MPLAPSAGGGLRPALGVSWEGRPAALLPTLAARADVIEVVPDALRGPDGEVNRALLDELDREAPDVPLTYHGIGLSIGSVDAWNDDYLRLLDRVLAWREPLWHSEHLGFTHVDGAFLGTMPALPTTQESLELVIERSRSMRARYGREFLLEHVASPLDRPADLTLAAYLNTLAAETGSRLLLDLHNIECDVDNGYLRLDEFLDELDWTAVGEIHVAGGVWHDGWHLDVHTGLVADSTTALLGTALERATNLELVVYEVLASAVPRLGVEAIGDQLDSVRALLPSARAVPA
jgi:uncharacterized protein